MTTPTGLAALAQAMGDPARAAMLQALMDGRALTAKELAWIGGVAPQTASGHLAKLVETGLAAVEKQGRHRYVRLAGPEVAAAVESLMVVAGAQAPRALPRRVGPDLAEARTCYDHFAGRLGVALHDALLAGGHLRPEEGGYGLDAAGEALFDALGVEAPARSRRARLRPCLDWSERRHHLAGSLAAAFACRCLDAGWVARVRDSRAVRVTEAGREAFRTLIPALRCDEPFSPSPAPDRAAVSPPP